MLRTVTRCSCECYHRLRVSSSGAAEKMWVFNSKSEIFSKDYNLIFIAWTPAKTNPFLSSNECSIVFVSGRWATWRYWISPQNLTVLTLIRSEELLNILLTPQVMIPGLTSEKHDINTHLTQNIFRKEDKKIWYNEDHTLYSLLNWVLYEWIINQEY